MLIKGMQKLTLLDYPGHTAATVFTFGCNLRCPFCHNASLVVGQDDYNIPEEEFFAFLDKRKGLLDGITVSGGEPTLYQDLPDFIKKIKDKGFLVKLDTNGTRPDVIKNLINNNLVDYIAMDVKNCLEKYPLTVGVKDFDTTPISESIKLIIGGKTDYEFRTTVTNELFNCEDFEKISKLLHGAKKYFLQRYDDRGDILNGPFTAPPKSVLDTYANIARKTVEFVGIRGI